MSEQPRDSLGYYYCGQGDEPCDFEAQAILLQMRLDPRWEICRGRRCWCAHVDLCDGFDGRTLVIDVCTGHNIDWLSTTYLSKMEIILRVTRS